MDAAPSYQDKKLDRLSKTDSAKGALLNAASVVRTDHMAFSSRQRFQGYSNTRNPNIKSARVTNLTLSRKTFDS
jgi:hypothetical protein